jgi:uncharacterized protein (TIGR02246 family)
MKVTLIIALLLAATMSIAQGKSDETTIRNILAEEVVAWNKGDARVYSQHFAADGTFTNIRGMFFTGHQAFLDRHEEIFKGSFRGTTLKQDVVSLRFIRPETAVVETLTWVSGFSPAGPPPGTHLDDKGRLCTRLLQVMVKDAGEWKITVYHNVDVKPGARPRVSQFNQPSAAPAPGAGPLLLEKNEGELRTRRIHTDASLPASSQFMLKASPKNNGSQHLVAGAAVVSRRELDTKSALQSMVFSPLGNKLWARTERGDVIALPVPNSPRETVGKPKHYQTLSRFPQVAIGRIGRTTVLVSMNPVSQALSLMRFGKPLSHGLGEGEYEFLDTRTKPLFQHGRLSLCVWHGDQKPGLYVLDEAGSLLRLFADEDGKQRCEVVHSHTLALTRARSGFCYVAYDQSGGGRVQVYIDGHVAPTQSWSSPEAPSQAFFGYKPVVDTLLYLLDCLHLGTEGAAGKSVISRVVSVIS